MNKLQLRLRLGLAATLLALAAPGCGDDAAPATSGPIVLFSVPASGAISMHAVPYPNDIFLDASGHPDLVYEYSTPPIDLKFKANSEAALKEYDGWAVTTGALFWTGEEIDEATLSDDNAYLVDLASGDKLDVIGHVRLDPFSVVLNNGYGVVLRENAKYAYVLTTGVRTKSGKPLGATAAFTAAISKAGTTRAALAYAPLRAWLTSKTVAPATIAGATVVTTKSIRKDLVTLRTRIRAAAAPALKVKTVLSTQAELDELMGMPRDNLPGNDGGRGLAHDAISHVIIGSYKSPNFINAMPGVTGFFEYDANGPRQKGEDDVPVLLVLPKLAAGATYASTPVVIFQHGLNGQYGDVIGVANELGRVGIATVGIDLPFHGERFIGATDTRHNFRDQFPSPSDPDGGPPVGGAVPGPDGLADYQGLSPSLKFTDIVGDGDVQFDARAIRANFLQSSVDHMVLVHLLKNGNIDELRSKATLPLFSFKAERLVYSGISFGSITGAITLAAEPDIGAAYLSVGGGGLLFPLLVNSAVYGPYFLLFVNGAAGLSEGEVDPRTDAPQFHPAYHLFQGLLDGGDPLAWAPYVLRHPGAGMPAKHLVMQSALEDESVPNSANEHLAAASGLPIITHGDSPTPLSMYAKFGAPVAAPVSLNVTAGDGSKVTAGWVTFKSASHGSFFEREAVQNYVHPFPPVMKLDTPIRKPSPSVYIMKQFVRFVTSYYETGTPVLIDPYQ